jgi:methylenetetrahydrofolate dehydrogenase (NADP+)/methenyltetrahydrofolate cyclohydrolase/formyltetrahydrofolate synthetase
MVFILSTFKVYLPLTLGLADGREAHFLPCAAKAVILMIKSFLKQFSTKKAVVIGDTPLVGRPTADILQKLEFNVELRCKDTINLKDITRTSDIVIVDIESPKYLDADWIKEGAVVIDAGMNVIGGSKHKKKIVGDVDFQSALTKVKHITPVPGGVGPLTIAMLVDNILVAWERNSSLI